MGSGITGLGSGIVALPLRISNQNFEKSWDQRKKKSKHFKIRDQSLEKFWDLGSKTIAIIKIQLYPLSNKCRKLILSVKLRPLKYFRLS